MTKTKKKRDPSPALALLQNVLANLCAETVYSSERHDHAMRAAKRLAVSAGLRFDLDDFAEFSAAEWVYAVAIQAQNKSAIRAIEHKLGRKPFIADDVDLGNNRCHAHVLAERKRERLAVGFSFMWKGGRVTVTSFAADHSHVVACSYHPRKPGSYENRIARRCKITIEDIRVHRKERKQLAGKK